MGRRLAVSRLLRARLIKTTLRVRWTSELPVVDCDDRCPHATLYTLAHALHRGPAQGFPVNQL